LKIQSFKDIQIQKFLQLMRENLMRNNSPPLEGWRKFKEFLTEWFYSVLFIVLFLTTPSSPVGRIHPSEGGELLPVNGWEFLFR
jgi:hypothetical protein